MNISTHAPLAGRDSMLDVNDSPQCNFNPRAPCGARRLSALILEEGMEHFNPRAPCGARLKFLNSDT